MKKFYFFMSAALMALVFVLAGCEQQVEVAGSDNNEGEPPDFTGSVLSAETGIIAKGEERQFTADTDADVTWTVMGNSVESETSISEDGLLAVGNNETAITLTVRAESGGEELGTARVKVKGWKDITANLAGIIGGNSNAIGQGKYMGIQAAAYGNGTWVVAGYSADDWYYAAVAWSKDDGDTWTKAALPLVYNESINTIIYDGPEGGKQFIIGGNRNNTTGAVYRSTDGINWKKVSKVMPVVSGNVRGPVSQLIYGEVEGGGVYVATNGTNVFAYSSDGIAWTNQDSEGNNLEAIKGKIVHVMNFAAYGSGLVGGKRVAMFRAWGLDSSAATKRADVYSTTGKSWTYLTPEEAAAQHFIPIFPGSSGYSGLGLLAMDVTKGPMFTGVIFRADGDKIFSGIAPPNLGKHLPCPDDESVYVYDLGTKGTKPDKYNNYVDFVVPGGGKYMAVGVGNRAAIAHAEAFD
jgi:hypothetical protein